MVGDVKVDDGVTFVQIFILHICTFVGLSTIVSPNQKVGEL